MTSTVNCKHRDVNAAFLALLYPMAFMEYSERDKQRVAGERS